MLIVRKRPTLNPTLIQVSEKLSLSLKNNENTLLDESLMSAPAQDY